MKQALIGTRLGALAQQWRDRLDLLRAGRGSGEAVGTVANDTLARVLLERLCGHGAGFIDVGAHIGSVIDGVRRHSRPGRIVAVEAIPEKAEALRRKFPDVELHCCAVGEEAGEASFFIDVNRTGYSSLEREFASGGGEVRELTVKIKRLDTLTDPNRIDVVKIDVEGAELGVLRGATGIIAASRPTIMFESAPRESGRYSHDALWRWFADNDYAVVVPNRVAHLDEGLGLEGFLEAHLYPRRTTNYFAIPRERRAAVRARAREVLGLA